MPNHGHDYRLVALFGWDLSGADGTQRNTDGGGKFLLGHDLLADDRGAPEFRNWFARGGEGVPAYGEVFSNDDLDQLTAFVVKMRDGQMPRAEQLFGDDAGSNRGVVLRPGADVRMGRERYLGNCAICHGDRGAELDLRGGQSVGSMTRRDPMRVWFKIQNGHPGSNMGRQLQHADAPSTAGAISDVLAALCDQRAFPSLAGERNEPSAHSGCGAYLE